MILHRVEVKEWLNSSSSCAKVNSWSGLDLKLPFALAEVGQKRASTTGSIDLKWSFAYTGSL